MAQRIKLRCDDFDVIGAVPRDLSVIKNFLKRDCAVKRLIDIEEDFLKKCAQQQKDDDDIANRLDPNKSKRRASTAKGEVEQPPPPPPDPCASTTPADAAGGADYCDPCRRLKTSVVLEELTKPRNFNSVFKKNNSSPPYFDEETVLDSSQPIKFRFRRKANSCDLERTSKLPCTQTEKTNVMVLTNTCDMMVWPSQKVAQMNRVPVTLLSGPGDLTEYMLEENTIM